MMLLETFRLQLFKCGEIFCTHFGQNGSFPQFPSCKKKFTGKLSIFCFFFSVSGIAWFKLKTSPDILADNLLVP